MTVLVYKGNQASSNPANTTAGFSPYIWGDCPLRALKDGTIEGVVLEEDWSKCPVLTTPTITTVANYGNGLKAFGDTGGTLVTAALENGGGLLATTDTTDNDAIAIQYIASPFKIARAKGDFWGEARLKTASVADGVMGIFVGLLESATLATALPMAADGTLSDNNFVGFHRLEGDGDQIDCVYKANGVAQVNVDTDVLTTALTADTFIKLGVKYTASDYLFHWYVNGIEVVSYTVPTAAGTDFPNDVQLSPTFAVKNGGGATSNTTLDKWRWVQLAA